MKHTASAALIPSPIAFPLSTDTLTSPLSHSTRFIVGEGVADACVLCVCVLYLCVRE